MIKTLDQKEKMMILRSNYVGHLGYIFNNHPYVVPITYYYSEEQDIIICYSGLGHKISALRKNSNVSISIANIDSVNDWKSILVKGAYREQSGSTAKALLHQFSLGVKELILNKEMRDLDFISQFSSKIHTDNIPVVFTIAIKDITGRLRKF